MGVFPAGLAAFAALGSLPHVRGGVSSEFFILIYLFKSSPRTWGCFLLDSYRAVQSDVFPTYVGVFPERAILRDTREQVTNSLEGRSEEFKSQVKEIGNSLETELKSGGMKASEVRSYTALVQTLVANMAADAGVSPKEIWEKHGLKGVLFEERDVNRPEDGVNGVVRLVSDKAKALWLREQDKKGFIPIVPKPTISFVETGRGSDGTVFKSVSVNGRTNLAILPKGVPGVKALPVVLQEGTVRGEHLKKLEAELKALGYEDSIHAIIDTLQNYTEIYASDKQDGGLKLARPVLALIKRKDGTVETVFKGVVQIELFEAQGVYRVGTVFASTNPRYPDTKKLLWGRSHANRLVTLGSPAPHPDLTGPQQLKQSVTQGEGNSKGEFLPDLKTIILWKSHDRSTFLHETGHWFLGARVALARSLRASGEKLTEGQKHLVSTMETVVNWLGYDSLDEFANAGIEERRGAEEQFARTFEEYLKEGYAPTNALQSLFRRFSSWLKSIYGFLAAVPGSKMDDGVRQLFDRLFVASEQQTEARLRYGLYQALNASDFDDERAYQAYMALAQESIDAANEQLTAKGMRDMKFIVGLKNRILKDMNEQAKKLYNDILAEEKKKYEDSKEYKAYRSMSSGEIVDGKKVMPRLSRKEVEALGLSKEQIEKLHSMNVLERADGKSQVLPGEAIAEKYGFSSLSELVNKLLSVRKPSEVAEERAKERMLNEHGEFSSQKQMELAAAKAVYNPATARMLAAEAAFLDKATSKRISIPIFRTVAESKIGKMVYGQVNPSAERRYAAVLGRESKKYQTGFSERHTINQIAK